MEKIFLVSIIGFSGDPFVIKKFATKNKWTALRWAVRFNKLIQNYIDFARENFELDTEYFWKGYIENYASAEVEEVELQ